MSEPVAADDAVAPDLSTPAEAQPQTPPRRRRRWWLRILVGALTTVVVLALAATGLVVWSVRRAFPQLGGELTLPGLSAPVTVYRDQYGIPHLYAETAADLFRAQGYVHAQDRFWEMDFRRHVTAGRLSELFGESQVPTDAFLRTLGWRRVAEQEWRMVSAQTRGYLEAYAAGVNAWIDQHGGPEPSGAKSLEYTVLGLSNGGYTVAPWDPIDSLAWLKAMAWDLRGNMEDEIGRAVMLAHGLTREQAQEMYPEYPYERNQPIVPEWEEPEQNGEEEPGDEPENPATAALATVDGAAATLTGLTALIDLVPRLMGDGSKGIGSNSWVIAGEHTASGKPLLANDPHLAASMPGIWYQIGLHCACAFNVAGFSFSGVPGVIIGHNADIAWGFTNLGPDVTDLYLEKIEGDRYYDGEQWQNLTIREELIDVAGGESVTVTVRSTKHGPVLSDRSQELLTTAARPGVDPSGSPLPNAEPASIPSLDASSPGVPEGAAQTPYGVALRWTALDPGRTIEALFAINTAEDWESFREAASLFEVPAQNIVYADIDGNIGYQSPGRIPLRGAGDGRWPAPGWDPAYDWDEFIPFDELPSVSNPDEGWIVTANQAVVGPSYPYLLTHDWTYGFRSQRIVDLLTAAIDAGPVDAEVIRKLQFDNRNGFAPTLIDALRETPGLPEQANLLFDWDFQQGADSAPAALYNAFFRAVLALTFEELPEDHRPGGGDKWWIVLDSLLDEERSAWWDNQATDVVEDRDAILGQALTNAVAELESRLGDDPADWRWGDLHTLELENATFGQSGIAPIEWLFNRGPEGTSGGSDVVNATGWSAREGYEVTDVPSMRMIVDLSNFDDSRWVQLTGNSGHAFHANYDDQFPLWRVGANLPMRWDRDSIEAAATHTLTLRP